MSDNLQLYEKDIKFLWSAIRELQVVFHPVISPDGKVDFKKLTTTTKKPCLFIDRNILISLLKLCEKGSLKNKDESQLVALLITWAEINDMPISAGLAIMEGATQIHSEEKARLELQKYQEAITSYPSIMWLRMAKGMISSNDRKQSKLQRRNLLRELRFLF